MTMAIQANNNTHSDKVHSFTRALFYTRAQASGGVMSLRIIGDALHALYWVLPALAHVSHADRWTVWLTPPFRPDSSCFENLGFNLSHTRVVHQNNELPCSLNLIDQALRCPTNAIVLAWPSHCDEEDLSRLQAAAQEGKSFGLVFLSDGFAQKRDLYGQCLYENKQGSRPVYTQQLDFKLQDDVMSRSSSTC